MSIYTYQNLYRAYLDCRKNKRGTVNALKFEYGLEENLAELLDELVSRRYRPGKSICFVVTRPKPREVFAADFRDRVVHHLLVGEILADSEKSFFFNSFACRKGKGTHRAVNTLKKYLRSASGNYREKAFYLQLDIKNFFVSISHKILFSIFSEFVNRLSRPKEWKEEIRWLAAKIIFHAPQENCVIKGDRKTLGLIPAYKSLFHALPGRGLPIGNYSSQFFANLYLNDLDYFIKQKLKAKYYVRYVDDLVILGKSENELKTAASAINGFLQTRLAIGLNLKKIELKNIASGIDFLGYFVKPTHTLVRRRVVANWKDKLRRAPVLTKKLLAQAASYLGHFRHADSYNLRRRAEITLLKYKFI